LENLPTFEYDILFLGEQNGAIASFDQSGTRQAVLCICSETGEGPLLIEALFQPFRQMFSAATSIDILFLDGAREADV